MGKIVKQSGGRLEASPFLLEFIQEAKSAPYAKLPSLLSTFPQEWPFPRGDLYNWVVLLNHFDDILEKIITDYGLEAGPQTKPFGREIVIAGSKTENDKDQLDISFIPENADCQLAQAVLDFTTVLFDNCSNRVLYRSSDRLSNLLNTTSIQLLKSTVQLAYRLAKRYYATRIRQDTSRNSSIIQQLLKEQFDINLSNLLQVALPFPKPLPARGTQTPSAKSKDRAVSGQGDPAIHPSDLVSFLKARDSSKLVNQWGHVSFVVHDASPVKKLDLSSTTEPTTPATPATPSVRRTNSATSGLSHTRTSGDDQELVTPTKGDQASQPGGTTGLTEISVSGDEISHSLEKILAKNLAKIPKTSQFEFLHRLRVAKAMHDGPDAISDLINIRILAIASLSFVHSDSQFQQKVTLPIAEEPRQYQLPHQLSEILQPPESSGLQTSLDLQTSILMTLEALCVQKSINADIYSSLNANVNHGVLFYVVRKAVTLLKDDDPVGSDGVAKIDHKEEHWRAALFELLRSIPTAASRAAENLHAAGILDVLNDVLRLRTSKARRTHSRVINFLDNFVHTVRESLPAYVSSNGLDVIADLIAFTVQDSGAQVAKGQGMPEKYKSRLAEYLIPFQQQSTIKFSLKFLNRLVSSNSGTFNRHIRLLFDSQNFVQALNQLLSHPQTYGSALWSGSLSFMSSFLNNEPTSYSVIAESKLNDTFFDILDSKLELPPLGDPDFKHSTEHKGQSSSKILPSADAILAFPGAIGALSLNEAGLKRFATPEPFVNFLGIFESQAHLQVLDSPSQQTALQLGSAFDELVRHHPSLSGGLKEPITQAIMQMLEKVVHRASVDAYTYGVGTKLWVNSKSSDSENSTELHVAGGRTGLRSFDYELEKERALSRSITRPSETDGDVPMNGSTEWVKIDDLSLSNMVTSESFKQEELPNSALMINTTIKFITGFCSNTISRRSFLDAGGIERILDLLTSPSISELALADKNHIEGEAKRLLQGLIEDRQFVILPAILHRLKRALNVLEPFMKHESSENYFRDFTDYNSDSTTNRSPVEGACPLDQGSKIVKAMTAVSMLTLALTATTQTNLYSHRSVSTYFSAANLADMYVDVIGRLGRLQKTCAWNEVLLASELPRAWCDSLHMKPGGVGIEILASMQIGVPDEGEEGSAENTQLNDSRDGMRPINHANFRPHSLTHAPSPGLTSLLDSLSRKAASRDRFDGDKSAQYENSKTLSHLLKEIPRVISNFEHYFARTLIARRVSDLYIKQKAFKVSDQMAKSAIDLLKFKPPKEYSNMATRNIYFVAALSCLHQLFMDRPPGILTVFLVSFKNQGGFEELNKVLEALLEDLSEAKSPSKRVKAITLGAIKLLLQLYSNVVDHSHVTDAQQSQALTSRAADKDKSDYFAPPQFLLELRLAAIEPLNRLWISEKGDHEEIVNDVIDLLRPILEAEGEQGAFTRVDVPKTRTRAAARKWNARYQEALDELTAEFDRDLAREALYRTYDSQVQAREYCVAHSRYELRNRRNPIPEDEQETPTRTRLSATNIVPNMSGQEDSSSNPTTSDVEPSDVAVQLNDVMETSDSEDDDASIDVQPSESAQQNTVENVTIPTIEDLEEQRAKLRDSLIPRCLDLLQNFEEISFELRDLVTAACKSKQFLSQKDIGSTVLSSLVSLTTDDELDKEEATSHAKKVGAYGHFLALVLQSKEFFDSTRDDIKEHLPILLDLTKLKDNTGLPEYQKAASNVLLTIEFLLQSDAEPPKLTFANPKDSDPTPPAQPLPPHKTYLASEERSSVFDAIINILPHVGQDDVLALAVLRILVILTRHRDLALRLSDPKNLGLLFIMVKQMAGLPTPAVQSSFMLILRHIIEDDETLKQVMRSEVKKCFENRNNRIDTTTYLRTMTPAAIRNPALFVQITDELVTLNKYDARHPQQLLFLKEDKEKADKEKHEKQLRAAQGKDAKPTIDTAATETPVEDALAVKGAEEPLESAEKADANQAKQQELKMPVNDNSEGLVQFILSELMKYKDVQDAPSSQPKSASEQDNATDVDMEENETAGSSTDVSTPASTNADTPAKEKETFVASEHKIYLYRCFLLQCLTELLPCYNKAKIDFINFRKRDAQGATPSKPRSLVLTYLLTSLIPTGTLAYADDVSSKKREATSGWAVRAINALCTKTGEREYVKRETDDSTELLGLNAFTEEPELLYVRKFVLEHSLKAFKEALSTSESLEAKYSRILKLAELFHRLLNEDIHVGMRSSAEMLPLSQKMLAKVMYEKNFISALTASMAEVDLTYPSAQRVIKYILKPLKFLTELANDLSISSGTAGPSDGGDEDEFLSDDSLNESDLEDAREETPDLFRNSSLGILAGNNDSDSDSDVAEDEEMYDEYMEEGEEYDEEMDYEEDYEHDPEEIVSDEDEDMGELGASHEGDTMMTIDDVSGDSEDDSEDDDGEDEVDDDESGDSDDDDGEDDSSIEEIIELTAEGVPEGHEDEWATESSEEEVDEDELDALAHNLQQPRHTADVFDELDERNEPHDLEELINRLPSDWGHGDIDDDFDIEDEMDEEEDYPEFDEDIVYEPGADDEEDDPYMIEDPWGPPPRHRHTHHHHSDYINHFWGVRAPDGSVMPMLPFPGRHSNHRQPYRSRPAEEGVNPLLQRNARGRDMTANLPNLEALRRDLLGSGFTRRDAHMFGGGEDPLHMLEGISDFMNMLNQRRGPGEAQLQIQIGNSNGGHNILHNLALPPLIRRPGELSRPTDPSSRVPRTDPISITYLDPAPTAVRWQEEAKILFAGTASEKANYLMGAIHRLLIPPARIAAQKEEEERRKLREQIEERERQEKAEREAKEKVEREAREKKEREEREAAEAEAAARRAAENMNDEGLEDPAQNADDDRMSGVEATGEATQDPVAEPVTQPQIMRRLGDQDVDIAALGIDPDYFDALPPEMREEVFMGQVITQRATQRTQRTSTGAGVSDIPEEAGFDQEFLEALPPEMREEIIAQERLDRRRQQREEERRRNAAAANITAQPEEMDNASFFATLPPDLRETLLGEVDDGLLAHLPSDLVAEARALGGGHRYYSGRGRGGMMGSGGALGEQAYTSTGGARDNQPRRTRPHQYVQIQDKAGVATLLRLMFIPQQGSAKSSLNEILRHICQNKHNRAEVVSILLSILQDGSNDLGSVERSFSHLSLRAKQPSGPTKTPQPKRSNTDSFPTTADMSPVMVVSQCLNTLTFLTQYNPRIVDFFLTEHETNSAYKPRSSRKGKGKDTKAARYPINALLSLLDRKLIIESSPIMESLATLLQTITQPLGALAKKKQEEKKEEERKKAKEAEKVALGNSDVTADAEKPADTASGEQQESGEQTADSASKKEDDEPEAPKKTRGITVPPEVTDYNLRLVVNIVAARECSSKTFKNTLALITHLSTVSNAKTIFGEELIRQAQQLGSNILGDLKDLLSQVNRAETGHEVQGVALSRFSPASSDQAKLLRVITALDYIFDPKRKDLFQDLTATSDDSGNTGDNGNILLSLYENSTFVSLWDNLGACLTAIRERGNMMNVATILLPLIEVLMVVCKNPTLQETPTNQPAKDNLLSSPPPESPKVIGNLFFNFTEEHRKILNELVRHNPKLMSGSFSLLVKNSKVLEFDNKRNYFQRKLHSRHPHETRSSYPSLQVNVKRDTIFLDSYRSLYFKKPDEFKFGKLNVRFQNEEGVDAGGLTREWFQVLIQQIFNPNYALFNPMASDRLTYHPNPLSGVNEEHLNYIRFVGRVIGKALYETRPLDCHFSRAVYKRVLGMAVSVKDMEAHDPSYYTSLKYILENPLDPDIVGDFTFSAETEAFGTLEIVDLVPNGRNIAVTDENKREYVRLIVEHKLVTSVKAQLDAFLKGFYDIIPADLVSIFTEQELELLISGLPEIDVDDWKNNTEYQGYTASSPQIVWFWRMVRSFDKEQQAKLLQFVTGTSKVPLNGFKELEGMNGFSRFSIHRDYQTNRLPSAHTCFNQLDLPEYDSYEALRSTVLTAIEEGSGEFGFA